jgi:TetR/AcrR family transcriptional regulator, cholesterol catabolism regulator
VKTERVLSVSKPRSSAAALRSRVIEAAAALFLSRGFVRVTADDIAARLGISKATLYKVFHGKEEILRAVVRGYLAQVLGRVEGLIADRSLGFVEKMVALLTLLGDQIARLEPVLVRDLQRHAPGTWQEIEAFRQEKIAKNFRVILESGRREGFFREDVDLDLLLAMFASLVREFVNPAALLRTGRSASETFESVIKVFFQGILTDKGRRDFSTRTPVLFQPRKEVAS